MSDIQPGDVVVCVAPEFSACPNKAGHALAVLLFGSSGAQTGAHYTVLELLGPCGDCEAGFLLDGLNDRFGICAGRFRKVEAADEQFTRQIKARNPQRIGEGV